MLLDNGSTVSALNSALRRYRKREIGRQNRDRLLAMSRPVLSLGQAHEFSIAMAKWGWRLADVEKLFYNDRLLSDVLLVVQQKAMIDRKYPFNPRTACALPALTCETDHLLNFALKRCGWTSKDVTRARFGDFLALLLTVVRGEGTVSTDMTIDCNADPHIPNGLRILSHTNPGKLRWDPDVAPLYYSTQQYQARDVKDTLIEASVIARELGSQLVMNASVLDFLQVHPELWPKHWPTLVYFWGTTYQSVAFPNWHYVRWIRDPRHGHGGHGKTRTNDEHLEWPAAIYPPDWVIK